MTRNLFLCSLVAVVASGGWSPATAQTSGDRWDVLVAPYILGSAMDGTTTMRGREVVVDASASDIFSNLQFGAMGIIVARKGDWGFGGDLIWMSLGTTVRNTNVDINYLYIQRGLMLTAVLYVIFLGMCIAGAIEWRRALRSLQAFPAPAEPSPR